MSGVHIGEGVLLKIGSQIIRAEKKKRIPVCIDDSARLSHWLTIGSTGTGKTRLLELVVEHDIKEGYSVCVFDPKPDRELFARIVYAANKAGRLRELIVVRPDRADLSAKVNPFAFYNIPEELVQHVMAGIPPSTEEFFRNIAYEVSTIVILGKWLIKKFINKKAEFTVEDLRSHISRDGIQRVYDQLRDISSSGGFGTPLDKYLELIKGCMADLVQSPQDYFAKVTSTLRTTLTAMVVGTTGDILGMADENLFMKRLLNGERIILVIQAPAMVMRGAAFILMRTILSMFQSLVGGVYLELVKEYRAGKLEPPLFIHIDELSEALYWDFVNLLNKSRGAGLGIHGLSQSISDLFAKVGEKTGRTLLDNFNIQLFMRVNTPETSRYISERAGKMHVFTRIVSGGEFTGREVQENVISETEVMELADREFILFAKQNSKPALYKGRVKFVKKVPLEVKL